MIKILKNKKAEGYIDVAVAVLVIAFILLLLISLWSIIIFNQDMKYMCNELLEAATISGRIGTEVDQRFEELCAEVGFRPSVQYAAEYFDTASGKVQLGKAITISLTHEIILPGFGGFSSPIDITVTRSGLSRVYWK